MKTPLLLASIFFATPLCADQLLNMPNGGTCWQNSNGQVYGCTGSRAEIETAKARQMEAANVAARQESLRKCLRMADQPKFPGRDECYQMFGH